MSSLTNDLPGRVMCWVLANYALGQFHNSGAFLSCFYNCSKIICSIFVCTGYRSIHRRHGVHTNQTLTFFCIKYRSNWVDILILFKRLNICPFWPLSEKRGVVGIRQWHGEVIRVDSKVLHSKLTHDRQIRGQYVMGQRFIAIYKMW